MSKRIVEPAQRRIEVGVAVLFLLTAATSIIGVTVLNPILDAPHFLAGVLAHQSSVVTGALLWSINNIGIVFIAVLLYPFLKTHSPTVATGYLAVRIIEGTVMMVGVGATLMLIPLSQQFIQAGTPENSWFSTLAEALKSAKFLGLSQLSLPLLGLGGILFTWQLVRRKLVPLVISITGLVGYVLVFLGGLAGWYGVLDTSPLGPSTLFALPVALFEIILLPGWLLWKGFR